MPDSDVTKLSSVSIEFGIFQDDTLSPLSFCITLNPLCLLLDCLGGYQVTSNKTINHLLYMEDLRLFAKNHAQLEVLLHTVKCFQTMVVSILIGQMCQADSKLREGLSDWRSCAQ